MLIDSKASLFDALKFILWYIEKSWMLVIKDNGSLLG